MNAIQSRLKSDGFSTIFEMAAKSFLHLFIGNGIYTVVTTLLFLPILYFVLDMEPLDYMGLLSASDPLEQQQIAQDLFAGIFSSIGGFDIAIILFAVFMLFLIASWFYNLCFISIESTVRERPLSFGALFKKSFNMNVFWIFLACLVITLLSGAGIGLLLGLGAYIGAGGIFIPLVLGFVWVILMMRFILVFPAIVHESLSVGEALKYSWRKIGFLRAFKYTGLAVLVSGCLMILLVIVSLIQAALSLIPVIGIFLYFLVTLAIGGALSAWLTAVQSGLFFRHHEEIEMDSKISLEDHLIL